MPTVNGRGYSEFTPDKETGYEKIMIQHLAIVNQIQKNWIAKKWTGTVKYYHIDCTSGPGKNPEVSCDGSPTITKRLLVASKLWYRMCCIEENPKSFSDLYKTLEPYNTNSPSGKISCIGGDYKTEIYNILNSIRDKNPYGLIYIDENTYPDWDIVKSISNRSVCKKMDILLHLSATTVKRVSRRFPDTYDDLMSCIHKVNKTKCLVRTPLDNDQHHQIFLFFTNMTNYSVMSNARMYDIDGGKGREEIMPWLNLTTKERQMKSKSKNTLDGWF